VLAGDVTPTETTDIGTRFFREYSEDLRSAIGTMAAELGISSIIDGHADGLLSAFLVRKPHTKQVVVHLVNYDIDHELDAIRPKQDVRLTLPRPDFFTQPPQGIVHHFAGGDADVLMSVDHDTVRVQIPTVNEAATVVLTASDEGPIR
jgi:hypothetical protein